MIFVLRLNSVVVSWQQPETIGKQMLLENSIYKNMYDQVGLTVPCFRCRSFYFIYLFFVFWEREREHARMHKQGRGRGRGRENPKKALCPVQSPMQGSISRLWDHDLSQTQEWNTQQTEPPRCPRIKLNQFSLSHCYMESRKALSNKSVMWAKCNLKFSICHTKKK